MSGTARIDGVFDGALVGWAWDTARQTTRLHLVVQVDNIEIGEVIADRFRSDLQRNRIGDGAHGFSCPLPIDVQDGGLHDIVLAEASDFGLRTLITARLEMPLRTHLVQGKVERVSQGMLHGWAWDRARPGQALTVEMVVAGEAIARTSASRFRRDLLTAGIGSGAHGFVFDLNVLSPSPMPGTPLGVRALVGSDCIDLGNLPLPAVSSPAALPDPAAVLLAAQPFAAAKSSRSAPRAIFDAAKIKTEAREAEQRRDFAQAATILDAGLRRAPNEFDLLFLRARVALAMNDTETATRHARAALKIRPGHVQPTVLLARLASNRGDHAEAVEHWAHVPSDHERYRERLVKRGRSLLALGRLLEALGEFCGATRLNPADRDAALGATDAAEAIGAPHTARRHLARYVAAAPTDEAAALRLQDLIQRTTVTPEATTPLRDPWLRHWTSHIVGEAEVEPRRITPWVSLRSLRLGERLSFAAAAPREWRPGDLPSYGLWLSVPEGGGELRFVLNPAAGTDLCRGVVMGITAQASAEQQCILRVVLASGDDERDLTTVRLTASLRIYRYALHLTAAEAELLAFEQCALLLRAAGPGELMVYPPQPICALSSRPVRRARMEAAAVEDGLRALGLGSDRARHTGPEQALASADAVR